LQASFREWQNWLEARKRRNCTLFPRLYWRQTLAVTAGLVAIAALTLDIPLGMSARELPAFTREFGRDITDVGKSGWILFLSAFVVIAGTAAWWKNRTRKGIRALMYSNLAAYLFLSVALSGLSANIIKRIIGRARPIYFDDLGPFHFSAFSGSRFESFPSGHSTTIGALFMAFALLAPRYRIAFFLLAVFLGMTRVIVGAHYPSDVIAGLAYGGWFSFMMAAVFSRYGLVFLIDRHGIPAPRLPLFSGIRAWKAKRTT
jgi:membrane-associated phospholipid phosphatase